MGMKILLDTHSLLWLVKGSDKLGVMASSFLKDPENSVWVSAVSAFEIAQKARVGKLKSEGFPAAWRDWLLNLKLNELSIDSDHALLAGSLNWAHRDPFDRMLVAQAHHEKMTLATADSVILSLPLISLLDVRA